MSMWTTAEAGEAWSVTPALVRRWCADDRVIGAKRLLDRATARSEWHIPAGTPKPELRQRGPKPGSRRRSA